MKSEKLLEAMNDLPEEMIAEANTRRRHPLVRIAAVAACFVVLLVGMYPFLQSMVNSGGDQCTVSDRDVLRFQGAVYEIISTSYETDLERLGLPETITEEMIGEKVDVAPDYGDVYAYAPLAGRNGTAPAALYLLERRDEGHEGEWWYLAFGGFTTAEEEAGYTDGETMFQVYGVQSAGDIASVTDADSGAELLEPEVLYTALMEAPVFGWDGFEEQTGSTMNRYAGAVDLRLETTAGLRSYMTYYPETGFLKWFESYYQAWNLLERSS